ncbi:MAG: DUF1559 domain-containing protein [Pirellulaceae bacterium]|nr:DUF1559 domain-containing protein [Pirellulaceae bacterium]
MNDDANTEQSPPPTKRPFQYGLRSLFVLTTVVALLLGLMTWLGYEGFLLSLLVLAGIAAYYRSWTTAYLLVAFMLLVLVLLPAIPDCREAARRAQCANNLKQLGVALRMYHDTHGSFPPAYIADKDGKPMHSWRVLILPYLGCDDLHKRYRFDEPWDGPNNRKLHGEIVQIFRCPSQQTRRNPNPHTTSYVAVVGPRTAWRGDQPVRLSDFTDALEVTILLVEMKDSGIHWMEPRDLEYPPMPTQINPPSAPGISSYHPAGAIVLFADGSIMYLSDRAKIIEALLTIDGGEDVPQDDSW